MNGTIVTGVPPDHHDGNSNTCTKRSVGQKYPSTKDVLINYLSISNSEQTTAKTSRRLLNFNHKASKEKKKNLPVA